EGAVGSGGVEREAERQTGGRLHDAGRSGKAERRCLSCHRLGNVDLADREAVEYYAHRQGRAADDRARGGWSGGRGRRGLEGLIWRLSTLALRTRTLERSPVALPR